MITHEMIQAISQRILLSWTLNLHGFCSEVWAAMKSAHVSRLMVEIQTTTMNLWIVFRRPSIQPHHDGLSRMQMFHSVFQNKNPLSSMTGWWLNQPLWKIFFQNGKSSPSFGVNIKNLWNPQTRWSVFLKHAGISGSCLCQTSGIFRRWVGHGENGHLSEAPWRVAGWSTRPQKIT